MQPVTATPGQTVNMILLPKFLGIAVFDQAHQGAEEAHAELQNPGTLEFLGPTQDNSAAGQVEIVTTAASRDDVNAIMISNNAGDQLVPALQAAKAAGKTVVTWDSPIPSGDSEDLFVAQVDFRSDRAWSWRTWRSTFWARMAASSPFCRLRRMPPTRMPGSPRCKTH